MFSKCKEKSDYNESISNITTSEIILNGDKLALVAEYILEHGLETVFPYLPPKIKEHAIKAVKLKAHLENMPARFSYQQCLLKEDRPYVANWLQEIEAFQKKCSPFLPPIESSLEDGDSEGVSFVIKKNGRIRGYLQGTMHYLVPELIPETGEVLKVSKAVQQRLFECAYIATEIAMQPTVPSILNGGEISGPDIDSIDQVLVKSAYNRAIPNIGIDEEDRGGLISHLSGSSNSSATELNKDMIAVVLQAILSSGFKPLMDAIRTGDANKIKKMLDSEAPSVKDIEINAIRNQRMAENIDILLNASPSQKGFFAIGAEHLIATKAEPESVVELLAKKGWAVELIHQLNH